MSFNQQHVKLAQLALTITVLTLNFSSSFSQLCCSRDTTTDTKKEAFFLLQTFIPIYHVMTTYCIQCRRRCYCEHRRTVTVCHQPALSVAYCEAPFSEQIVSIPLYDCEMFLKVALCCICSHILMHSMVQLWCSTVCILRPLYLTTSLASRLWPGWCCLTSFRILGSFYFK